MSVEISTHTGTYEIPNSKTHTSNYPEIEITVTRFWGGAKRGTSIQLTLVGDSSYIQLDNQTAKEFAQSILDALEEINSE